MKEFNIFAILAIEKHARNAFKMNNALNEVAMTRVSETPNPIENV